jgi:type II secretory pathway predicted ATPase ExeA
MYEAFYGLRERPFELTANPRYLFLTVRHREALSTLIYGLSARKGLTVLIGEAGTGKTTLLSAALEQRQAAGHLVVALRNPAMDRRDFLEFLAREFALSPEAASSKTVLLHEMEALLRRRHEAGLLTALVLDEAHSMPIELLEEVRLLANIETADTKLLPLIMLGQPELADRLNEPALRQLKQRIALRCRLDPLDLRETAAYIAKRIRLAGGDSLRAFTREAVSAIYTGSGGVPRLINVICDNALVSGMAAGEQPVGQETIREVCADFDLPVAVTASPAPAVTRQLSSAPLAAAAAPQAEPAVTSSSTVILPPRPVSVPANRVDSGLLSSSRLIPIDAAPAAEPPAPSEDRRSWFGRVIRGPFAYFRSRRAS